jgi:hypothetical protein
MSQKIIKEKELVDLLRADKPAITIENFEKLIAECANIPDMST